eukprot:scaffold26154_cov58-Phaeocystis_antarctica.AAC.2
MSSSSTDGHRGESEPPAGEEDPVEERAQEEPAAQVHRPDEQRLQVGGRPRGAPARLAAGVGAGAGVTARPHELGVVLWLGLASPPVDKRGDDAKHPLDHRAAQLHHERGQHDRLDTRRDDPEEQRCSRDKGEAKQRPA